jgi:hypothetical protein
MSEPQREPEELPVESLADDFRLAGRVCIVISPCWIGMWLMTTQAMFVGSDGRIYAHCVMWLGISCMLLLVVAMQLRYRSRLHWATVIACASAFIGIVLILRMLTTLPPGVFAILLAIGAISTTLAWSCARRPIGKGCPSCSYSLEGLKTDRCPECGTELRSQVGPTSETQSLPQA